MKEYDTHILAFIFSFTKVFPSENCRTTTQIVSSFLVLHHTHFEGVEHNLAKANLRLTDTKKIADLKRSDSIEGHDEPIIVTTNGKVNLEQDTIAFEILETHGRFPNIGVTGLNGEYRAIIGYKGGVWAHSEYGSQSVGIDMYRKLQNKCEYDESQFKYDISIKAGDVIQMIVEESTLTFYHNNDRIGPFQEDPIRLLESREYKFCVGLRANASVRIVKM